MCPSTSPPPPAAGAAHQPGGTPATLAPSGHPTPSRANRVTAVVAAGALGAACLYTATVDPSESSAYPQCPLRLLTGVDCALCGGLRSVHALAGGDIIGAASRNLLVVALAPLALWAMVQWFAAQWGRTLPGPPLRPWMFPVLLVVVVVYSVVRNLTVGPGPWLHSDT